ncbi:hypothetical protein BCR39DRAFT_550742 [Naematelia encephala]|uniref:FAD-binding domain-containing protein n=1 Tax=Naematelia encephala TaxID=71784 RepID=A0A1Y2ALK7_9TREE|nr:hypothetical protein BCR39DRAFT_550742 [Naematelia encephala]
MFRFRLRTPSFSLSSLSSLKMQASTNASRVLIVGGGIGGLSLAQSLCRTSIPFTVFERDPSPKFRAQGYRLGHNQMGDESLQSVLGEELYKKLRAMGAGEEDRGLKAAGVRADAVSGETLGSGPMGGNPASFATMKKAGDAPPAAQGPRVRAFTSDRTILRSMLGLGLESHISYGKRFSGFSLSDDNTLVTARFDDGTSESGAVLVGADGIQSRVYSELLSVGQQPPPIRLDLERRCIYGKTRLTPGFEAAFPEKWRKGMSIFKDPTNDAKVLFMDPVIFNNKAEDLTEGMVTTPENYLYWVISTQKEEIQMGDEEFLSLAPEKAVEMSLKLTQHWNPQLRVLLEKQDVQQCAALRLVSAPPNIPERPSHSSVTALGDAVHPMSPAGGSGANTAIRDAAVLGSLLKDAWQDKWEPGAIARAIEDYEGQMRGYASQAIAGSFRAGKMMGGMKDAEEYKPLKA